MCINFALFNEIIEKNNNSISIIKKYLLLFYDVKWLTVLNLAFTYWQILLTKRNKKYITFLIIYKFYQFWVMPFGLVNISATFQRLMSDILKDYLRKFYLIYLGDIIIYSKSFKDYKWYIRKVL